MKRAVIVALLIVAIATALLGQAPTVPYLRRPRSGVVAGAATDTIALDNTDAGIAGQTGATFSSFNHTVTSNTDGILLCGVDVVDTNLASVSSITYNSVGLTLITGTRATGSSNYVEIWGLLLPATGTHSVVVTLTGAPLQEGQASCVSLTGVHQSLTPDSTNTASGTSTTPSVSTTTVAANAWILSTVAGNSTDSGTAAATAPSVKRWAIGTNRAGTGSTNGPIVTPGSTAMAWTGFGSGQPWVESAVSFAPGP